jgi:hypothetical protein
MMNFTSITGVAVYLVLCILFLSNGTPRGVCNRKKLWMKSL